MNGDTVPAWVVIGCYVLGWALGVLLILDALFGVADAKLTLLMTGIYLIFFPVIREGPGAILRRLFGDG